MARKACVPFFAFFALLAAGAAWAGDCPHRGELDAAYCDADRNLVADPPSDPAKFRNPSVLVFTYTPVEDPAVYEQTFKPFTDHLAQCTARRVVFYPVQSNAAQVEAMRSGRLHFGGFSTGPTAFAVNLAGAVPFAVKGDAKGYQSYTLDLVVRADSPIKSVADLKGRKVAHTSPSSNSGNLAPRALFPKLGVTPEKDYTVLYSGGHDRSVLGVRTGDYQAAPVASDVFDRMVQRGTVRADEFRVIWRSTPFPTSSFAYAHDLEPALRDRALKCFHDYRFTPEMQQAFDGADRFVPITYQKDWAIVREVATGSGESFGATAFQKLAEKEAAAKKK